MTGLEVRWLGRVEYREALALQERCVEQRRREEIGDTLLLLEHEPVYTMGRSRDRSSLGETELPHPVVEISRGGLATYHGPGQLIGYPILDLRQYGQDLHRYLRLLEESLISLCAEWDVTAHRREGLTGVWVEDRKIASIGVGVRHWISLHGFALNVGDDLAPFAAITPCGIHDVQMTSLSRERSGAELGVESVGLSYPPHLQRLLSSE